MLSSKKQKKKAAAEKAGLAPPALNSNNKNANKNARSSREPSPAPSESEIDWLENKKAKTSSKQPGAGSRLFASFRNNKNAEKARPTTPPKASWKKKKDESAPKKAASSPRKAASPLRGDKKTPASPKGKGKGIDNIVVEETYVTDDDNAYGKPNDDEASKAKSPAQDPVMLARRKAVIQDSWDFYRLICSLVCDRDRYHETFRSMQKDPVYPYLNSLTSVNDPYNVGYENFDKAVVQADAEEYKNMTKLEVATALEQKAHDTLNEFVELCKSLAGNLGVEELGIGPVKEAALALRKAQRKYDGDLLKVTDFCRALIIVDDFAALLGLLELVRDSYGDMIRRVKLSTLKASQPPKVGGYRDCIINMEVNGHICELQVHLKPLWEIGRTKGYKHYGHSLEYKTDSFKDAYASLKGLDRKTLRELIALADDLTSPFPLDNVQPHQEKIIMDYFAMSGLYYKVGSYTFGEIYFSRLVEMRMESMGALHPQTEFLNRYYLACLRKQNKEEEALAQEKSFADAKEAAQLAEKEEEEAPAQDTESVQQATTDGEQQLDDIPSVAGSASFWDALSDSFQQGTNSAYDLIMDPNRKVREEEQAAKAKIRASKRAWRAIRRERYPFLDGVMDEQEEADTADEETREDVEDAKEEATEESAPFDEKPPEAPGKVEATEKKESAPTKETKPVTKEEPAKADTPASEHVEEKKEDGGEASSAGNNDKAVIVEDEAPSAFSRLMDQACSMCASNQQSS